MSTKKKFRAAAILVGWALIVAGLLLLLAACAEVAFDVVARVDHEVHWGLWGLMLGLEVFGVLLVQTGEMTEALETLSERMPGIAALVASVWPGGRRLTDRIVASPPPPPQTPPQPPPTMEGQ
jgi:hypothetical protein